jgi:hypothetical protein
VPVNVNPKPNRSGSKRRAAGWTLLALGMLVAAAWLWTASNTFRRMNDHWLIGLRGGTMLVGCRWGDWGPSAMLEVSEGRILPPPIRLPAEWEWWWWGSRCFQLKSGYGCVEVVLPLWPIPLLLCTLAALLLRSGILACRRSNTGSCAHCGYSLAGLAADLPCPECGKEAKTTA